MYFCQKRMANTSCMMRANHVIQCIANKHIRTEGCHEKKTEYGKNLVRREHRRDRNSFLCESRFGVYYRLFVSDETLYLMRVGDETHGVVARGGKNEQEVIRECGRNKTDRVFQKNDILCLRYREKDRWAWGDPVNGLLVIQTRSKRCMFGVVGGASLQDVRDALVKFPNADIDDGAKKQAAMELERGFALRRTAEGYRKARRICSVTGAVGIMLAAAYFFCSDAVQSLLVVPVTILPSLLLLEYLLFAAYMDYQLRFPLTYRKAHQSGGGVLHHRNGGYSNSRAPICTNILRPDIAAFHSGYRGMDVFPHPLFLGLPTQQSAFHTAFPVYVGRIYPLLADFAQR